MNIGKILEKYKKTATFVISFLIFVAFLSILFYFLQLRIFKNGVESYSLADQIYYTLKCSNERHIKLREHSPVRTYETHKKYDNLENENHVISTNKDGLIEPAMVHDNPDLQIFFVGGSTTECETVSPELRFPYYSGRLIEKKLGRKINSDNAAKSGNNSIHSINILINKILPLKSDMVVMMHNINDLSTLFYEGTYWNYNKTRSNLSCTHRNRGSVKYDEWANSNFAQKSLNSEVVRREIVKKFEDNLQLFIFIAKSQGIIPVLMTQPNIIENNENFSMHRDPSYNEIYKNLYSKFNEKIREVALKNNVLMIDLAKKIPQKREYIYDDIHVNNKGSVLESEIIANSISVYLKKIKYFN